MPDITGDGINDVNLTSAGSSATIGGAIFTDAANVGSGTGGYNTFLAIQDNNDAGDVEAGFNSDDKNPLDSTNTEIDASKTHTILLSNLVITTINGVQYYEVRVDLNESNSAPDTQISLDQFKVYSSTNGSIESTTTLFTQNLVYDMDAAASGGNVSVLLSEAGSSGSGTDDYSVLIPVSQFAGLDPTTTFIYFYIQMGAADLVVAPNTWGTQGGFEEWNLQNGITLSGVKFADTDGDGVRDAGEAGVGGVTIFIDSNSNGTLDVGERSTVTAADGSYSFFGVALGQTLTIDEVTPAGQVQTTGNNETVTIPTNAAPGSTILVDPIGNFTPNPALNVTKAVTSITGGVGGNGLGGANSAGDVIHYAITVANTGNVPLTGITVTDPNADAGSIQAVTSGGFNTGDTDHDNVLDVGETWNYTALHTVTQGELDNKGGGDNDVDNTVTADSNETGPDTADAVAPLIYSPSLNIVKDVTSITGGQGANGLNGADSAGDKINYSISVQNTGNVTLTGLTVTDPNADAGSIIEVKVGGFNTGDTDKDGVFDVGETWNYTAVHTVTQGELDNQGGGDGDIDNIATADTNETDPDTDPAVAPLIYSPSLNIVKDVNSVTGGVGGKVDSAGDVIHYDISVDNTGNVTLTGVSVTDPYADAGSIQYVSGDTDLDGKLDVDETWHYTAQHTVLQAEIDSNGGGNGSLENVATAHSNETPDDTDDAEVPLAFAPNINIIKDVSSITGGQGVNGLTGADSAGDVIHYAIQVQNTGNVSLTNVVVTDPNADAGSIQAVTSGGFNVGDTDKDGQLDTTEVWSYIAAHTVTQGELDNRGGGDNDVDNTATANSDQAGPDSDNAEAPLIYAPGMNVTKAVSSITGGQGVNGLDGADSAGDVIHYGISVQNTGNVTLTGLTVTDPNADAGSIQEVKVGGFNTGDTDKDGVFDVGETWNYTANHTVTQAELDGKGIDATGAVDGDGDDDNIVTADTNETPEDTADASAPLIYNPDLNIVKDVSSITGGQGTNGLDGADSAGDKINYSISVTNTGNVTLTGLTVTDPNADAGSIIEVKVGGFNTGDTDKDGVFDVGETWNYTAVHTVTQGELDNKGGGDGDIDNIATADTNETGPDTDPATAPLIYNPALNIVKDVSSITGGQGTDGLDGADSAGDVINYAISVQNTGNISLTGVTVTDPNADAGSIQQVVSGAFNVGDTNQDGVLSVGETWQYTAQHTVTQGEIDNNGGGDGDVDNIATADSNETPEDTDPAEAPIIQDPQIHLEKDATVPGGTANTAGEKISYTLAVSNTGNMTLTGINVTDPYADAGSIQAVTSGGFNVGDTDKDGKLDLTETWQYTAEHTVTQGEIDNNGGGDGKLENTATVTSTEGATDDDDADVPVERTPALNIIKDVSSITGGQGDFGLDGADDAGDVINYAIAVQNTGNVTLTGVTVTDPNADAGSIQEVKAAGFNVGDLDKDGKLDVGETWYYTAQHTVTQGEIDSNGGGDGDVDNIATADSNETPEDTDPAEAPIIQDPAVHIEKDATVPGGTADTAGEKISYTLDVTNTGNVTLTGVAVTDPYADAGSIKAVLGADLVHNIGDTDNDGKLDLTETWQYTATHTVTQGEIDSNGGGDGKLENTATVNTDQNVSDDDDADVPVEQNPHITVDKDATVDGDCADTAGELVNYTINVTNDGNVTLDTVAVTDPMADAGSIQAVLSGGFNAGDTDKDGKLDVGETWQYTAYHTATQDEIDAGGNYDSGDPIDGINDSLRNVATVTAEIVNSDTQVTDDDDAVVEVCQNPHITVEKDATVDGDCADTAGEKINYSINVTNDGNVTLDTVNVTDPMADAGSIAAVLSGGFNVGDLDKDGKLDVGETWQYTAYHTVTQAEIDAGGNYDSDADKVNDSLRNVATATAEIVNSDTQVTDDDDAVVEVCQNPSVDLTKYVDVGFGWDDANTGPGPQNVNIGGDVSFKITIENTGNVTLTDVDVTDTYLSGGAPGTPNLLIDNGVLTAYAIAHGAVLSGDSDHDGNIDVGETWEITYTEAFDPLAFQPGAHLNTADVTDAQGAEDEDSAYYFSLVDEGLCPRTPGFWQNPKNGAQFWDGISGNEKHAGEDGFPTGELLYAVDSNHDGFITGGDAKGLLIGDYNKNGLTDAGEDTLFVSFADAQTLINASNKQLNGSSGDGRFMLGRDMVASWLNYLQGSGFGDDSDPNSPTHYLNDAIDWMQIYSGTTNGGTTETFDKLKITGGAIKTSDPIWKNVQSGFDHSGSQMHNALDYYNNTGQTQVGGVHYANCCSCQDIFQAISIYQDAHDLI